LFELGFLLNNHQILLKKAKKYKYWYNKEKKWKIFAFSEKYFYSLKFNKLQM
jgi:hypothetical protein